jgi:D-glycero-alpha-D-manno-heptose 1-phosphate guanylyltransferase
VFVFNGDTYLDLEVAGVEAHWQRHHVPIIVARDVSDTARYGRLITDKERVIGFSEKGMAGPGLINAGCYVLPVTILDQFAPGQAFSLETDFLAKTVGVERFDMFITSGHFIDIGVPEDYLSAQAKLAGIIN